MVTGKVHFGSLVHMHRQARNKITLTDFKYLIKCILKNVKIITNLKLFFLTSVFFTCTFPQILPEVAMYCSLDLIHKISNIYMFI